MEIDTPLNKKMMKNFDTLTEIAIATPRVAAAKVAAAIVYKNRIISVGVNSMKTNPFQVKYASHIEAIYPHAETAAIKNALRHVDISFLHRVSLLICRIKSADNTPNNYVWGMAKPCIGCQRAIVEFEIKNVFYTTDDQTIEKL